MKSERAWPFILGLLVYLGLAYFYFVVRDDKTTLIAWSCASVLFFLCVRSQAFLLFFVGIAFGIVHFLQILIVWMGWPLDFLVGAVLGFLVLRYILRRPSRGLKWSMKFSKVEMASILIINVPAILILTWYFKLHPEVANSWPKFDVPSWTLPLVVIAIAVVNGLREEIFFRGLIQTAFEKSPAWFAVSVQAVLFGFMHYANAFPQGWIGVFLTALWGAAIAIQYRIFKSFSLVWVTHIIADAIMFAIILSSLP